MNRRERYAMARRVCRNAGGLREGAMIAYAKRSEYVSAHADLGGRTEDWLGALDWHACWTTIIDCIAMTERAKASEARRRRNEN